MTLYQGNTFVDSWSESGKGKVTISESCKVNKGKEYKLVLDYTVNGADYSPVTIKGVCE